MSSAAPSAPAFRLVSEHHGPRFLGLTVGERNARVARRAINARLVDEDRLPTLVVPAGIAIMPGLFAALPAAAGTWMLVWDGVRRPITWHNGPIVGSRESRVGSRESGVASHSLIGSQPMTVRLPHDAALDVSTAAARRRSAWQLVRASGKPTDGWLSRHLHRRISRVFSYALLQMGVTANAATALTFLVGAWSAWLIAQTSHETMIAGALLFWFASIADGIDGEMARLTLSESRWGEQLDTAVDHATYFLCYAGLMVGWWRQGMGLPGVALALGVALGIPIALLWGMNVVRGAHVRRTPDRRESHFFVDTKPIELAVAKAARQTRAPALQLSSAIFILFRREVFSLTFFLVSLVTSRRAVYPALLAGGLAVVTATLVAYRRPIERALHT